MYNEYFGFRESPFSIAPDPRYLYMTGQHREALAHLVYGLNSVGGCILLTGEVGTGKTTICRCLLEQLPEQANVALLLNPKVSEVELLETICDELHIAYPAAGNSVKTYTDRIYDFLINSYRNNEKTVLIIDEAQNLDSKVLEQLRLLTNLETHQTKLLQIIILGQPELLDILSRSEMRQLAQRITARFHLRPLNRGETRAYVSHRLAVAGQNIQLFPEHSIRQLFKLSNGIPRLINVISDRALLGAYVENQYVVSPAIIKKAAKEVFGELKNVDQQQKNRRWSYPAAALAGFAVLVMALLFFMMMPAADINTYLQAEKKTAEVTEPAAGETPLTEIAAADDTDTPAATMQQHNADSSDFSKSAAAEKNYDTIEQILNADNSSQTTAYQQLLALWNVDYQKQSGITACKQAEKFSLSCLYKNGNLNSLRLHNRPAVLTLLNADGQTHYVTLSSLQQDSATIYANESSYQVRLADLDQHWYGQFTLLWQKPEHYRSAITPGSRGHIVNWLYSQLSRINHEFSPDMIISFYDEALVSKVKNFQTQQGLEADGIVGPITIIYMNTLSGLEVPSLMAAAE